jgi:hypothetical protein
MNIREVKEGDFENIWPIFLEVIQAGDTYGYSQNTSKEEAQYLRLDLPRKTFVLKNSKKYLVHIL